MSDLCDQVVKSPPVAINSGLAVHAPAVSYESILELCLNLRREVACTTLNLQKRN